MKMFVIKQTAIPTKEYLLMVWACVNVAIKERCGSSFTRAQGLER
jgi:hypothetical protein